MGVHKEPIGFGILSCWLFQRTGVRIKKHPIAELIADLALSKGKVTQYFLLKGLEKIANFMQIKNLIDKNSITQQQIQYLLNQFGLQLDFIRSS